MHSFKGFEKECQIALQRNRNTLSSPKPGMRGLTPHGLVCTTHYSFLTLQFEHQGALSSAGEGQSCLVLAPAFPQVLKPFLTPWSPHPHAFGRRQPKSRLTLPHQGFEYFVKTNSGSPRATNKVTKQASHPRVHDPPPSTLLILSPPSSPHNNGHIFSFLGLGNLSKRTQGSHAELQVNLSGLLQSTSCKDLCSIFMDYDLRQTLGNEVTIQYVQGSAELQKLSKANRFSPFIYFPVSLLFWGRWRHAQCIAVRIYGAK